MGMHSTYTATHYKDLNIDWQARAVTRHGEDILLTPQEFALLQVLFDHRGQAVSRGDLLHTAWGYPCSRGKKKSKGNTAQFPPCGLSTAPAAAARHLRCQNAR